LGAAPSFVAAVVVARSDISSIDSCLSTAQRTNPDERLPVRGHFVLSLQ
jgi:hypothetical protein